MWNNFLIGFGFLVAVASDFVRSPSKTAQTLERVARWKCLNEVYRFNLRTQALIRRVSSQPAQSRDLDKICSGYLQYLNEVDPASNEEHEAYLMWCVMAGISLIADFPHDLDNTRWPPEALELLDSVCGYYHLDDIELPANEKDLRRVYLAGLKERVNEVWKEHPEQSPM